MIILFETAAGFALFKIKKDSKLGDIDYVHDALSTSAGANKLIKLAAFEKFKGMEQALKASKRLIEGKVSKKLKKLIKNCEELKDSSLAVADPKIGAALQDSLNIDCITSPLIQEIMRSIRENIASLIPELDSSQMKQMALGLAHSFSRYRLKFNPDRIDTMIIQGINLLDDIDKEINNYIMRCREWYGWHYPELGKIVSDNLNYIKIIKAIRFKSLADGTDLSGLVDKQLETEIKAAATVSMGSDITDEDMNKIIDLCDQIVELSEYKSNLLDYITNRMQLVAPNLSILVGELVGARLIAHAGSLINLSKQPSSTVQVLGAEKALFNALKSHSNTPKYGLIYHAGLVAQASMKLKGKMSRTLAAKCALAIRCDALSEQDIMTQHTVKVRANLEKKLNLMEQNLTMKVSGGAKFQPRFEKYTNVSQIYNYNTTKDTIIPKKRKFDFEQDQPTTDTTHLPILGGTPPTTVTKKAKTDTNKL